jgi:hypothetical protein
MNRVMFPLMVLFVVFSGGAGAAQRSGESSGANSEKDLKSEKELLFRELSEGLPKEGERANSARLELEYWRRFSRVLPSWVRQSARGKDGKQIEVILISAPSNSMPGEDFSMAFLLVEKRVVDWASCWSYNRIANQELLLEDVDGDGFPDVAFRASEGCWGLLDDRQHSRPGDKRKWLYAYAITAKGFQSLFPKRERNLQLKLAYDTVGDLVTLKATGLPQSLREYQMVECILTATNKSKKDLPIPPGDGWFTVKIENAGCFMTYGPWDKRALLKARGSISQTVCLFITGPGSEKDVTMRFKFRPEANPPESPQPPTPNKRQSSAAPDQLR